MTALNESVRKLIEPGASTAKDRLHVLEEARRKGIETYAFVGPLLPGLSDTEENLSELMKEMKEISVSHFYVDRLNLRYGVWPAVRTLFERHYPQLLDGCRRVLFNAPEREAYTRCLASRARRIARERGIEDRMILCF